MTPPDRAFSPIAIIGMGCRFPGALGVDAYWHMMLDGVDAISEVPPSRWDVDEFYDPRPATPCKVVTRCGGFIPDIDQFDPYFFGISPREAIRIDPQQRLLLEVTWEAMERAGIARNHFVGSRTGVFVGVCSDDYITIERGDLRNIDIYMGTGGSRGTTAGRLAFIYDLTGPTAAIDTACSSSLVAVHQACNSLHSGDCDMALAGGVNVVLHPGTAIAFSQANMLSPDGRCKAFDARANGFVRSEGAGVVLLKPLETAQRDSDPIYAVIRATASNNDGSSSAFMTPSRTGQAELLRSAYARAAIPPQSVQYVEAHGTGTEVGDPIEAGAIADVICAGRARDRVCLLGSSKTNIGHTEAAAGVAGLIKTALCLYHGIIPPNLHFETPNPNIPWEELPLQVPTKATPWPASDGPARAAVNSFGISGTNAHIVLEQAPPLRPSSNEHPNDHAQVLALSAHTAQALDSVVASYISALSEEAQVDSSTERALRDICYSAVVRRTHHEHRVAIVARSSEIMRQKLEALLAGDAPPGTVRGAASARTTAKPVFIFSGIGTQWAEMGMRLRSVEPVFRDAMLQCDTVIRAITGWSVIEEIDRPEATSRLGDVDRMQPAIFSLQVSLAALWKSWGVTPSAIVGHSLGEIAAAHVAGALSLEDAALAACERSRLMHRTTGQGRMAAVGLSAEATETAIASFAECLSIAAVNSSSSCAITGDPEAIATVAQDLDSKGVFCRVLKVEVACHSAQMDPLRGELATALSKITPRPESVPLYSTVLARRVSGTELNAEYWAMNLRQTVRFADTVNALADDRAPDDCAFVELSPNPALLTPLRQIAQHRNQIAIAIPSLRAGELERDVLLEAAGSLFVNGLDVDWNHIYAAATFVPPPPYAWQRERFWFSDSQDNMAWLDGTSATSSHSMKHPLLKLHWESAADPGTHCFEAILDLRSMPSLNDHRVEGMPLLPAAAYVEMALAASIEIFGSGPRTFKSIKLDKAVFLSADHPTQIQLVMRSGSDHGRSRVSSLNSTSSATATFHFYCRDSDTGAHDGDGREWTQLASGHIDLAPGIDQTGTGAARDFSTGRLDVEYENAKTGDEFYADVITGMSFGPSFRNVRRSWARSKASTTLIELSPASMSEARSYRIHPALLDACFHSIHAPRGRDERLALPFAIDALTVIALPKPDKKLWCEIQVEFTDHGARAVLGVFDDEGNPLIRVDGYHSKYIESGAKSQDSVRDWLYESRWQKIHLSHSLVRNGDWLIVGNGDSNRELADTLDAHGNKCTVLSDASTRVELASALTRMAATGSCVGIIHLGAHDAATRALSDAYSVPREAANICRGLFDLLQSCAAIQWNQPPRIFVVSRDSRSVGDDLVSAQQPLSLAQSPLAGLARVAAAELNEFRITQIDLGVDTSADQLVQELLCADQETEVALRGPDRNALRLVRVDTEDRATLVAVSIANDRSASYQLQGSGTGVLDDLELRTLRRRSPGDGEVEIRVAALGLNFLDVLKALNMAPGLPDGAQYFGMECSGRIVAIGAEVTAFEVGDEVIAMDSTASGCFRAFLTTNARAVFRKPANLSFEEAATIPIAYQTAYYALCELGRIRGGESILIHSAAGGVGMAALEIARQRGAVIYATAGTEEKRDYLRGLGVRYVMNSRTLDFAREIMERTEGRGVDLVLNSLAGDAIAESLNVLATGGRFLEIGKRDIYADSQIGLLPFQKNLSFFAIDLLRLRMEKPHIVEELTRDIAGQIALGNFPPLPFTRFPGSQAVDAFRYMAQGKHIGKIVITLDEPQVQAADVPQSVPIRRDATYVITGGLGALGIAFARRLVDQGAQHLALIGRSAPSAPTADSIDELRSKGADITVVAADVADVQQLAHALDEIRAAGPPIRGVLHAAGITDDRTLLELRWEQFVNVFAAKVDGGWNLHQQLLAEDLDFFVLFSSAASVLGGAGQANYAAANSFLDALAHYRRRLGMKALSVNWGPWADIGMAAQDDIRGGRLAARGLNSIPTKEGTELLDLLMQQRPAQVAVMPIAWPVWAQNFPEAIKAPFLSALASEWSGDGATQSDGDNRIGRAVVACESKDAAVKLLSGYLRAEVARILRIAEERINSTVSLIRFGLDSLMAVELRSRIENDFGVRFPTAKLLQGPSVADLADWIAVKMRAPGAVETEPARPAPEIANAIPDVSALSDGDVNALLHELLTLPETA